MYLYWYLPLVVIMLVCAYFFLSALFTLFFQNKLPRFTKKSARSAAIIFFFSIFLLAIVVLIPDPALSNRFQHAISGGFISFFICYLVVRDQKIPLSKFQFFVFSSLVVTGLGVANELAEFAGQVGVNFISAKTIIDTWLDLTSNTVGILLAALIFVPKIGQKK